MDVSLYQAAAAMSATAQWQDLIAQNLSSASVSGARKQEISFSDVAAGLTANSSGSSYYLPTATQTTNFKPGELCSTGKPLDFALEGPGFFTVQLANGQQAYSRDGEFRLDAKGQMVNKEGYKVLGANGPLQFNPGSSDPITISADGDVSQGLNNKGKIQITEFQHPEKLDLLGADTFRPDSDQGAQPTAAVATKVRQGFVEASNASPMSEMASMINAMRMFESNQKVLQMQSDRMSRVITDLGGGTASS